MGILHVFSKSEFHLQLVFLHKHRIFLSGLFEVINGVEQRHHVAEWLHILVARIILQIHSDTMAVSIPVAYIRTNYHLTLKVACEIGDIHLIEHLIYPLLTRHHIVVVLAHAKTCEESHQFQWHIVVGCRHKTRISDAVVGSECRHAIEVLNHIKE